MARTTKVVGFSLPPAIHNKLEKLIKKQHKTRSEFYRDLIEFYFSTPKSKTFSYSPQESDLAKVLQTYWN
ncbi:hypothetical protein COV13_00565, partial [Candidatus Woesearchaeota archaeon CG10_big_fil_rev_8_21_14_0_10_32_9]